MKIIVFDADPATRDQFDAALAGHDIAYFEGPLTKEALIAHPDAEVVSIFVSSAVRKEEIDALPKLQLIAARSTGVDNVEVAYAIGKGISVAHVPKYGARTVAEFTFGLMLSLSRRVPEALKQVREEGNFTTSALEGFDLFGKTLGVVGTGAIGRAVVGIARGFGMQVLMYDPYPAEGLEGEGVRYVSLDELLHGSDIVTLHVPLMPETVHLIDAARLAQMKQGAFIINTARGELIDTAALVEALKSGRLAGAGLDVLEEERALKDEINLVKGMESINELKTVLRDHVLIDLPHTLITPHIAFFSREAYGEILSISAANIAAFAAGMPQNIVHV